MTHHPVQPPVEGPEQAAMVARMLQGVLVGSVMRQDVVKVADVEQLADAAGTYLSHFTVVTGAGHRVRVTTEVEPIADFLEGVTDVLEEPS